MSEPIRILQVVTHMNRGGLETMLMNYYRQIDRDRYRRLLRRISMNKKISIIMGIYNCATTLPEAIDSILAQTYTNWELILCEDGSSDNTYAVAEQYRQRFPDKIILLKNEKNLGLNKTLNRCLESATGDYIARMDGDDLSIPTRLEKEARFLDEHPDISIVSCPMIYFDEHGDWGRGNAIENPTKTDFVRGTPFCHAPCMVRAEAYRKVNGYSENQRTLRAEDYYLWFCMYAAGFRGANLTEPLYKMRDDENAYRRRKFRYALNESYVRLNGYRMLGLPIYCYLYVVRPILVSLMPRFLYDYLHHKKQTSAKNSPQSH